MSRPRLLVADDNPMSLQFLAEAFTQLGVDVVSATDGGRALALAQEHAFDLLVLDLNMPVHDGCAVLAMIRAGSGPSRAAPIWATSAELDVTKTAALKVRGFDQVLAKPITIQALRDALARRLPQVGFASESEPTCRLDDAQALRTTGGDAAIVIALRGLFAAELAGLPAELAQFAAQKDRDALRARLHRLSASAGFCGAPGLIAAIASLRERLEHDAWPDNAIESLLIECGHVHDAIKGSAPT